MTECYDRLLPVQYIVAGRANRVINSIRCDSPNIKQTQLLHNKLGDAVKLFFVVIAMFVFAQDLNAQEKRSSTPSSDGDSIIESWLNGDEGGYKIEDSDDELTRLKKQRVNIVLAECRNQLKSLHRETEPVLFFVDTHKRLRHAQLDLLKDPAQIRDALSKSLQLAQEMEATTRENWEQGKVPSDEITMAVYFRLDCEIALEKAKLEHRWSDEGTEKERD